MAWRKMVGKRKDMWNQDGDRWANRKLKDKGKDEEIDLKQLETRPMCFPVLSVHLLHKELQQREMVTAFISPWTMGGARVRSRRWKSMLW